MVIEELAMERELGAHQLPAIRACPYIRQVVDIIEKRDDEYWGLSRSSIQKWIVLEWMDTDL